MSKTTRPDQAGVDRWAAGRDLLRTADPRMAELVDAEPGLDPDRLFDRLPSDLWGALVLQVIGQQLSLASATPAHSRRRRRARRTHPRSRASGGSPPTEC